MINYKYAHVFEESGDLKYPEHSEEPNHSNDS